MVSAPVLRLLNLITISLNLVLDVKFNDAHYSHMKTTKHFATCAGQQVELKNVGCLLPEHFKFRALDTIEAPAKCVRHIVASGGGRPTVYEYAVGLCPTCNVYHFAERLIFRPSHASNHACNGKCRAAKGPNCECSCKGANHGAN
jgi:hypothetical protein